MKRVAFCGRILRSNATGVGVRVTDAIAGFSGLQHCGSVWSCAVCSAGILTHRALEMGSVLAAAVAQGHALGFVTLTMRHGASDSLSDLWDAARDAWARSTQGREWAEQGGAVVGWVRVWEVTTGRNGWHVHVHFVLVLAPGSTAGDLDRIAGGMFHRWSLGLTAAGQEAPQLVGQDWRIATGDDASGQLAEYLFKLNDSADEAMALGLELTHSMPGRSRSGHATLPVWSILERFAETGETEVLDRWHEWEQGSKGRQQVGWSRGARDLRAIFAPELEVLSDDEVADREVGTVEDELVQITMPGWKRLVAMPYLLALTLEAAEQGLDALRQHLDFAGIDHFVTRRPDRC